MLMLKMIRACSLIALLLISAYPATAQSIIRTPMGEILDDLYYFSSLFPRLEGSREEKAAYSYIKNELDSQKVPYTEHPLTDLNGAHSFSSSLIVSLPGSLPDTLNIVVPLDHPADRGNGEDGSVNLALGLALIREFEPRKLTTGLRILFLGAEYSGPESEQLGSREFLADFFPEAPQAFLYLAMEGIPDRLLLRGGGEGIVAPYWHIRRIIDSLEDSGLPYRFKENENQIHRLGMWHDGTRINPYLQAGYPSATLEGTASDQAWNSTRWFTSFFRFFFSLEERNSEGFLQQWDRHYLYFNLFGRPFSISEGNYIYLLLGILIIPLGYPFFMSRRFVRYLRILLQNFWDIPVLLALIFLFLLVGTFGLKGLLYLKDYPSLWQQIPFAAFLIKGGIALIQFFLVFSLLRHLPFSQNSSFYSSAALFLFMLGVVTLGLLDISMTHSVLWAFAGSFIFTITPSRIGKSFALIASTLLVLKTVYDVFTEQAYTVIEYLLLSPLWGNLFLALLVLPFLLMLIRLDFLVRHPSRIQQKIILRNAGIIAASSTLIGVLYLFGVSPYAGPTQQPVEIRETISSGAAVRLVRITSPAPIEALLLTGEASPREILSGRRIFQFEISGTPKLIDVSVSRERFLDRERYLIDFSSSLAPKDIDLSFTGRGDFLVYDVNFPFSLDAGRESAEVHIGRNPPLPLRVDIVFPESTVKSMKVSATFAGPAPDLAFLGNPYAIDYTREYRIEIPLAAQYAN